MPDPPRQHGEAAPVRVGFVSLGCAKNLVDSQIMAGALLTAGMELAPAPEEADAVVVNTCAFIEDARAESIEHILHVCNLKQQGRCRAVVVAGCLSQRYRADLKESLPEVDAFIGLDELERIPRIVEQVLAGATGILEIGDAAGSIFEPRLPGLAFSTGTHAYLKIAEGCNHPCAFCAIPAIRGRHRSRDPERICAEARHLLQAGFRELDLISQDVTAYGLDTGGRRGLPDLLCALDRLPGDFQLRLLYGYPTGVTPELLRTMRETAKTCAYLDVPVQHSHPDILRAMQRADTIRAVQDLPARTRAVLPDIALRTTCLVGFPGETEQHVEHLVQYLRAAQFDHLGVFAYSPEDGTPAAELPDRPSPREADARRRHVLEVQQQIVSARAAARIGTRERVRLERCEQIDNQPIWLARSTRQAPEVDGATYVTDAPPEARPGDVIDVRITLHEDYDFWATAGPSDDSSGTADGRA